MLPLRQFTQLGSALDRIGRAAAPGSLSAPSSRPVYPAPAPFHSPYLAGSSGFDLFGARSIDEAMTDNGRAREYQGEAPKLGSAMGAAFALLFAAWFGARRK